MVEKCAEVCRSVQKCIGLLALQGDFDEHRLVLESLGMNNIFVRTVDDLAQCNALILPGGESTVMMKLLRDSGLDQVIAQCVHAGMPVFGTCAGAILLSRSHLNLMDITIDRNAYGSQLQSFSDVVAAEGIGRLAAEFIRAPKIIETGPSVHVLARHDGSPVLVKQGNMLASTFHTETTQDTALHNYFLQSATKETLIVQQK